MQSFNLFQYFLAVVNHDVVPRDPGLSLCAARLQWNIMHLKTCLQVDNRIPDCCIMNTDCLENPIRITRYPDESVVSLLTSTPYPESEVFQRHGGESHETCDKVLN